MRACGTRHAVRGVRRGAGSRELRTKEPEPRTQEPIYKQVLIYVACGEWKRLLLRQLADRNDSR